MKKVKEAARQYADENYPQEPEDSFKWSIAYNAFLAATEWEQNQLALPTRGEMENHLNDLIDRYYNYDKKMEEPYRNGFRMCYAYVMGNLIVEQNHKTDEVETFVNNACEHAIRNALVGIAGALVSTLRVRVLKDLWDKAIEWHEQNQAAQPLTIIDDLNYELLHLEDYTKGTPCVEKIIGMMNMIANYKELQSQPDHFAGSKPDHFAGEQNHKEDEDFEDHVKRVCDHATEKYVEGLLSEIQKLKNALSKIDQMSDMGTPEAGIIYMKQIASAFLSPVKQKTLVD